MKLIHVLIFFCNIVLAIIAFSVGRKTSAHIFMVCGFIEAVTCIVQYKRMIRGLGEVYICQWCGSMAHGNRCESCGVPRQNVRSDDKKVA